MENSSREDPFEEENRVESTRRIFFSLDFRKRERERDFYSVVRDGMRVGSIIEVTLPSGV